MTTTSSPSGIKIGRDGKARLNLRLKDTANIRENMRKNGIFTANLTAALKKTPKYVLGAFAAQSLYEVMNLGKHDSSRGMANWDLAVSGVGMRRDLSPLHYNTSGPSWGSIGGKGDAGANWEAVMEWKWMYYGIDNVQGDWVQPMPGGLLHTMMGIGKEGNYRVELFNPILGNLNERRAGGDHTGHTYAYYLYEGEGDDVLTPGLEKAREQIGNGFVPWIITFLNTKVQEDSKAGRITKL